LTTCQQKNKRQVKGEYFIELTFDEDTFETCIFTGAGKERIGL
jgi:hypothetical protein